MAFLLSLRGSLLSSAAIGPGDPVDPEGWVVLGEALLDDDTSANFRVYRTVFPKSALDPAAHTVSHFRVVIQPPTAEDTEIAAAFIGFATGGEEQTRSTSGPLTQVYFDGNADVSVAIGGARAVSDAVAMAVPIGAELVTSILSFSGGVRRGPVGAGFLGGFRQNSSTVIDRDDPSSTGFDFIYFVERIEGNSFEDQPIKIERYHVDSSYEVSADLQTLSNLGSSDNRNYVATTRWLFGDAETTRAYWEVECLAGDPEFNGYAGVASDLTYFQDPPNAGRNPNRYGAIGYRGNGTIWSHPGGSTNQALSGLLPFGSGDVVMLAFDAVTHGFWCGVNGTWNDDPELDPPTFTTDGDFFCAFLQARGASDSARLRSLDTEFSYNVPAGFTPLCRLELREYPDGTNAVSQTKFALVGPAAAGVSVKKQDYFAVVGATASGPSARAQTLFAIVEP